MTNSWRNKVLTWLIATVWLANGLLCKVLNLVPRHREIVGDILGDELAAELTVLIGIAEIGMAIWILSGIKTRLNAWTQIAVVLIMNIIEFTLVPDLLLWGRFNILFAILFVSVVYYNAFMLNKQHE